MRQKSGPGKAPAEHVLKDIRRATRRHFLAEEKIRIVLEGLRGKGSMAELCRRGDHWPGIRVGGKLRPRTDERGQICALILNVGPLSICECVG